MDVTSDQLTDAEQVPGSSVPPPGFIDQVRQSLEHLHDLPYMQSHHLAPPGSLAAVPPTSLSGQHLRRELLAAIESLSPGPGVPFRAPHARLYNVLHLHYVEGMTVQEAAHELSISSRQAYRDLRHGEDSVAAVLWERLNRDAGGDRSADRQVSSPRAEIDRLEKRSRPVDARVLTERALAAIDKLARARGVRIERSLSDAAVMISADPAGGPQVLVSLLSQATQQAGSGTLRVSLEASPDEAILSIRYSWQDDASPSRQDSDIVAELINRLGWGIAQTEAPGRARAITVRMPRSCPTVLIIDDNEGLGELIERYLAGYACRVIQATSAGEGQRLARDLAPDMIVLDVMMPEVDGWQALQTLKNQPDTADIPVIICSVFNDPELAYSLGAKRFLTKPVSRDGILAAMRELRIL